MAQQPVLTRVTAGPGRPGVAQAAPPRLHRPGWRPRVSPGVPVVQAAPRSPACPQCSAPMSRRVARSGSNTGKEFWGCSTYPKCKGTRLMEEPAPVVTAPEPALIKSAPEKSSCPDCGTEMALRKFQSGPRLGEEFYGCVPCKKGWSLGQMGQVGSLLWPDPVTGRIGEGNNYTLVFDTQELSWSLSVVEGVPFAQ